MSIILVVGFSIGVLVLTSAFLFRKEFDFEREKLIRDVRQCNSSMGSSDKNDGAIKRKLVFRKL